MAMYDNTMPSQGQDVYTSLGKICQILTTGAVGPTSPTPYDTTDPRQGDEVGDLAAKLNQAIHVNGGL